MNTGILEDKNGLVRHIHGLSPEIKELNEIIFHLGFNRGSYTNKTDTHASKLCVTVSYSSWNGLHRWVVELVILVFKIICSNHIWKLLWTSVPYYYFSPPRRGGALSSLFWITLIWFIFLRVCFCKETPVSLYNVSIFFPVILVNKFHPLRLLQYFCLYWWFINFISCDFFNIDACKWWFINFTSLEISILLPEIFCYAE